LRRVPADPVAPPCNLCPRYNVAPRDRIGAIQTNRDVNYEVADETVYTTAARDECGGNRKVGRGSQLSHICKASRTGDAVAVVVSVNVAD